jgi:hypothetical protein
LDSRSSAKVKVHPYPVKAFAEDSVRIHHSFLLVEMLGRILDEAQEGVYVRSIRVDDIAG